jgi:xanthine dehydrogenase YagS FAD-binding subunit
MIPFTYERASSEAAAVQRGSEADAAFLAGGTTLVDLMKLHVLKPARLVDVGPLPLRQIERTEAGLRLGALATNAEVARHAEVKRDFPAISEALLAGASPQLRNVATTGGNLLQRTRCAYFRDLATACNKREPGTGCAAMEGWTRMHAILGTSGACIAAHPSDFCVALSALDATVRLRGPMGERVLPFEQLHLLPGETPNREFALQPGELITAVEIPASVLAARSRYVKVRDRESYAFALTSCAASVELDGKKIKAARIALGGVATKPWRAREAEQALVGSPADAESYAHAAELALRGAQTRKDNAFKVELCKRTIVRALTRSAEQS